MKLVLTATFEVEMHSENRAVAMMIQENFRRKVEEFRDSSDPLIADGKSEPYRMGFLRLFCNQIEGEFE